MSRFVSSGAIDPTSGDQVENTGAQGPEADSVKAERNKEAWEAVQREVEEEKKRKAAEKGSQDGGKSLYEILQENKGDSSLLSPCLTIYTFTRTASFSLPTFPKKERSGTNTAKRGKAAKQAAFEEKTKLSNQFRALDDDEIEFLDDVQRAKREEEARLRRETEEGLRAFREAQKGGEREAEGGGGEVEDWGVGRKRKRRDREGRGVRRRVSSGVKGGEGVKEGKEEGVEGKRDSVEGSKESVKGVSEAKESKTAETTKPAGGDKKPKLGGLVDYGSDESE